MAGLKKICSDMRAKCPYCNRRLDLSDFGNEIFRRVLKILSIGKSVSISNFGSFRAPITKGRDVSGLKTEVNITRDKRIIRFRASNAAKKSVNRFMKVGDENDER